MRVPTTPRRTTYISLGCRLYLTKRHFYVDCLPIMHNLGMMISDIGKRIFFKCMLLRQGWITLAGVKAGIPIHEVGKLLKKFVSTNTSIHNVRCRPYSWSVAIVLFPCVLYYESLGWNSVVDNIWLIFTDDYVTEVPVVHDFTLSFHCIWATCLIRFTVRTCMAHRKLGTKREVPFPTYLCLPVRISSSQYFPEAEIMVSHCSLRSFIHSSYMCLKLSCARLLWAYQELERYLLR